MAYSFIDTLFANGDDMDPSPFWVLMALCWFVNEKKATGTTGACWPSIKKIAAKAHVSELTARKSIKVLMEKKFITAHQPPGKVRVFYVDFSRIKELAGGKDLEGVKDVSGVKDLEGDPLKMLKGRGERSLPPPLKDLEAEQGIEQGINKEENKEVMCAPSGNSSAIAAVASAQAQTLPTSFPQSSNSQNHSEAGIAGKDSLPNASERSVAAHRDRLDASDEQTIQNDAGCSQNASTCISEVCPENEPPPMSDEDLENLFADAQLAGSKPNTVKAEAPKHRTTTPRKKPATRCPFGPDASIPPEYLEIAQKAGIGDPQQVFSAFVNHAIAHDRSLVIWPAGFRTWCSNELRYHPNQTPKPKPLHQRTAADYDW